MFKIKQLWVAPESKPAMERADLLNIETVINRQFEWFEAPNHRRGGWSGVTRVLLNPDVPDEQQAWTFLKIQKNHCYRAPRHFFRKRLTFLREFEVLQEITRISKAPPEVLLFAHWAAGADAGAILVTKALDDWFPLNIWFTNRNPRLPEADDAAKLKALESIAHTLRELHSAGWVHLNFSAKHLFIRPNSEDTFDVRVIDFEKCRRHLSPAYRTIKDCSHFMRHTPQLTDAQKLYFLQTYFRTHRFTPRQHRLIQKMRGAPSID